MLICTLASRFALNNPKQTVNESERSTDRVRLPASVFQAESCSSPLLSLVTSTSEISHQPVHTYTTCIYDKGVDRTGRQGIEEKYSIT